MYCRIDAEIEGPDRIYVSGNPHYFTEAYIRDLLEYFGRLRAFNMIKDSATGTSKLFGFCAYQNPAVTDIACDALNGIQIGCAYQDPSVTDISCAGNQMGNKKLVVRRVEHAIQPKTEQELQTALQRLTIQPGGSNEYELESALRKLMIQQ